MPKKKDLPRYLLPAGCKDLSDVWKLARVPGTSIWGPTVLKRIVPLCLLAECLEDCLRAAKEGLFFVELSPEDFLGIQAEHLVLVLRRPEWLGDLERVRRVAAEQGLTVRLESAAATSTQLIFGALDDPAALACATVALLEEGFSLPSDLPIKFLTKPRRRNE